MYMKYKVFRNVTSIHLPFGGEETKTKIKLLVVSVG